MTGNNPRNYYIAAAFFALLSIYLGYRTWVSYHADRGTMAALFMAAALLCLIEVLLLFRNGKRRARGIPPKGRGRF